MVLGARAAPAARRWRRWPAPVPSAGPSRGAAPISRARQQWRARCLKFSSSISSILSSLSTEGAELFPRCSWDTAEALEQRASPGRPHVQPVPLLSYPGARSPQQPQHQQLVPIGFKPKPASKGSDTICIPRASVQTLCFPPGAQQMLAFVCSLVAFPRECELLLNLTMTSLFVTASAGFGCVCDRTMVLTRERFLLKK